MIKSIERFTLFLILCCLVTGVSAQDFPKLHYTEKDGLPSNTIYEIYRDSKGFLWFATDKGVARYNGLKFEVFTTFNGMADNEIFFFQEDKLGRLWLGSYNGELCYFQNETFHNAANTPFLKIPFTSSFIQNISILNDSSVAIGFDNRSSFLIVTRNSYDIVAIKGYGREDYIRFINTEKTGDSGYVFNYVTFSLYINNKNKITRVESHERQALDRLFVQNIIYFYNDSAIYNTQKKQIARFRPHFFEKYSLHRIYLSDSSLFLATNNSLIINDTIEILKGNKVSSLTQDKFGNYWISTTNNGVFVLKQNFLKTMSYANAYQGITKYAFAKQRHAFFATNTALFHLRERRVESLCNYAHGNMLDYSSWSGQAFFIDSNYRFFYLNNKELGVVDNLLSKQISFRLRKFPRYSSKSVTVIGNDIYVRGIGAVYKYTYCTPWNNKNFNNIGNSWDRIFCMAKSDDNRIWYSTVNGMYAIVNDSVHIMKEFSKYPLKYFDFFGDYMLGYTHKNQLLICTDFGKTPKFDSITSQNCIWDRFYRLDSTHILISTNNLYRLLTMNGANKMPAVSIIEDDFIPLQAEEICSDSANCYFFKDGTITSIDLKSLYDKSPPPTLWFKNLKTGHRSYPIVNDIQIPYTESKAISISFATLAFGGKNIIYQYSVSKTAEDNWREIVGDINLAQTSYGTYTIKIRAKSSSSPYCMPAVFTLTILHPFWATWWFIIICIFIVVLIIATSIRYRISRLLRKKEKKHKSEVRFMKSEYKALNALMNPHFIFNTLNNVQDLINKNDKLAANEYLRIFSDLVRQNMHNTSKDLISLQKELELVNNYLLLEKLRFEDKLNYSVNVEPNIDLSEIMIPPLLIQPLVENSLKHGILHLYTDDGFIGINVKERNNTLFIEVKDNGVGMNFKDTNSIDGESHALDNIKKRLRQLSIILNKNLAIEISEVKNEAGKLEWTVVIIAVPLS